MNIMDLFKPAAPKTPEASATKSDPVTDATKAAADANAKADPNNPAKSAENPLDVYAKLFQNASANSEIQAPSFNIDPQDYRRCGS